MRVGRALLGVVGVPTSVFLVALCCSLTVPAVALVAGGAAAWLAVHGLLLAIPAVVLATVLLVWRRARRTL